MSKYLCATCGMTFNRSKDKLDHEFYFEDHFIVKKMLKGRITDFLFNLDLSWIFKVTGTILILEVFIHYFRIEFSSFQALFLGIGIGLLFI